MVEIRNTVKGKVLKLVKDGNTTYVYVTDLMNKIWDDYIRAAIDNVYTRGLLKDMQFTDTQIFHMLEQLQVGRREYDNYDYLEVAYK
jgi:hypothetical protein